MATVCPYCNIEVSESAIEAEDGCCPECGSVISATSSFLGDERDEYDDDRDDLYDDLDDNLDDDDDIFDRGEFGDDFDDEDFDDEDFDDEDFDDEELGDEF